MIGFNIRLDVVAGFQLLLCNDYGITVMATEGSTDTRCMFGTCAIGIAKVNSGVFDENEENFDVENKTLEVMEKMKYVPSEEEKEQKLFLNVNISKLFEVVEVCKQLEIP